MLNIFMCQDACLPNITFTTHRNTYVKLLWPFENLTIAMQGMNDFKIAKLLNCFSTITK